MNRRRMLAQILALGAAPYVLSSQAFARSGKPVTLVVPFTPGGNHDVVARAIAPAFEASLGRTVIVDNRPGAGGAIGATIVSRADPDGSTLLLTAPNSIVVLPKMTRTTFSLSSFAPVGMVASTALAIIVKGNDARFPNISAFLTYARANPGSITAGHPGPGTVNHLAILLLEDAGGLRLTEVPYKGAAPALVDLMGGQIDMVLDQIASSAPHIQYGAVRALAVMSHDRDATLPNVPTLRESGLPAAEATTTSCLFAPANTPAPMINELNAALRKALTEDSVRSRLSKLGSMAQGSTPQELQALLQREESRAQTLAAAGRLKITQ